MEKHTIYTAFLLFIIVAFAGCSDDSTGLDHPNQPDSTKFTVTLKNIAPNYKYVGSGVFNTPAGDSKPGPATPGKKYQFIINAGRSQHLSFSTMLAATNDLFYGPDNKGIALYDETGDPISADVTDQVYLWDAGTEVNEEPAVGANTVTNQPAPNTGEEQNGTVMKIADVTNGVQFDYPKVSDLIDVKITHMEGTKFKVVLKDLSSAKLETSAGEKPAPMSPGVWVVHGGKNPLYTPGKEDFGQGVEAISEDGDASQLGNFVAEHTGVTYPASPGVWDVAKQKVRPLYTQGKKDYGDGVEAIAEDGSIANIKKNLQQLQGHAKGILSMPKGSDGAGPILPGQQYTFSFYASQGENISFATMLAATNDIFFGPRDTGIPLFDTNGDPLTGDVSDQVFLWDAGTEKNEQPAIGLNTVTNQLSANTGTTENKAVRLLSKVNDGYKYPSVKNILKVTISTK